MNGGEEEKQDNLDHADFFSIAKVDTHIHAAAAFSARDFLDLYVAGRRGGGGS